MEAVNERLARRVPIRVSFLNAEARKKQQNNSKTK